MGLDLEFKDKTYRIDSRVSGVGSSAGVRAMSTLSVCTCGVCTCGMCASGSGVCGSGMSGVVTWGDGILDLVDGRRHDERCDLKGLMKCVFGVGYWYLCRSLIGSSKCLNVMRKYERGCGTGSYIWHSEWNCVKKDGPHLGNAMEPALPIPSYPLPRIYGICGICGICGPRFPLTIRVLLFSRWPE